MATHSRIPAWNPMDRGAWWDTVHRVTKTWTQLRWFSTHAYESAKDYIRCWCSVARSCLTLCDPMNCSTPGFPVLHYVPDFAQTLVHWVGDATQPAHPLSSPSPVVSLSQHQGLFQLVRSSHQVAKVLEFQLQHQSFQWIFRTHFLLDGLVGSPCSPRDSQESSLAPQFKNINSSALSLLYGPRFTSVPDYWRNHSFDYTNLFQQSDVSAF